MLLFEQKNEKTTRVLTKVTVVGTAEVLSYEEIVEAQQKHNMKDKETVAIRGRRISKRSGSTPSKIIGKRTLSYEREEAMDKIWALGIEEYCSVLNFQQFLTLIPILYCKITQRLFELLQRSDAFS